MPRIRLAALLALVLLAALAGSAKAASPTDKKIAALTKQVNALQKQVKTLSTQLTATRRELTINFGGDTCAVALLADIQMGTWSVIDQIAQATQGKTYFGQQPAVSPTATAGRTPMATRSPMSAPTTLRASGRPLWRRPRDARRGAGTARSSGMCTCTGTRPHRMRIRHAAARTAT